MSKKEFSNELPPPPATRAARSAIELVRIWAVDGQPQFVIASDVWEDPAAWGILLVDLARHVANAVSHNSDIRSDEVLARIRAGFDAEWTDPDDGLSGEVVS